MLEGGDLCTNVPKPLEPASTIVTMPCPLPTFRTRLKLAELVIGSIAIVFFGGWDSQTKTHAVWKQKSSERQQARVVKAVPDSHRTNCGQSPIRW